MPTAKPVTWDKTRLNTGEKGVLKAISETKGARHVANIAVIDTSLNSFFVILEYIYTPNVIERELKRFFPKKENPATVKIDARSGPVTLK